MIAGVGVNQSSRRRSSEVVWVVDNITQPVGQLFLRLLLMIVVPLCFASLVVGVAGIGDIRKLGRVGLKSFGYCLVISAISAVIGLTLANTIRPGKRIDPRLRSRIEQRYATDATKTVESAKASSADAYALNVGGGNDRSEEPVLRDRRQRRREHAAPDVLRARSSASRSL